MVFRTDEIHPPDVVLLRQLESAIDSRALDPIQQTHKAIDFRDAFNREQWHVSTTGNRFRRIGWTPAQRARVGCMITFAGMKAVVKHPLDDDRSSLRQAIRGVKSGFVRREKTSPRDNWILGKKSKGWLPSRILRELPERFGQPSLRTIQRVIRRAREGVDISRRKFTPHDSVRLSMKFIRAARAKILAMAMDGTKDYRDTKAIEDAGGKKKQRRMPVGVALPAAGRGRKMRVYAGLCRRLSLNGNHWLHPDGIRCAALDQNGLEHRPLKDEALQEQTVKAVQWLIGNVWAAGNPCRKTAWHWFGS